MKIPGTIADLITQVEASGYQLSGELKFDSEGHLIGLPIRPAPITPTANTTAAVPRSPRRSPTELFSGAPQ